MGRGSGIAWQGSAEQGLEGAEQGKAGKGRDRAGKARMQVDTARKSQMNEHLSSWSSPPLPPPWSPGTVLACGQE